MIGGPSGSPLVSAVVIFCNEVDHLAEAVASVVAQTFDRWELLIVDDGSTDGSTELARRLADRDPDRIRYLAHPGHVTRGMSASRNLGVEAATGRYVAHLDGDDRWLPQKLEYQVRLLHEQPEARIVYGPLIRWFSWTGRRADLDRDDLYGIHGDGYTLRPPRMFSPPELVSLFIRHKDLVPSGAMFERELFLAVGGAEPDFTDNYEDAVAFVKMGLRATAYCAAHSWYLYRQYPEEEDRIRRAASRPDADRPRGDAARRRFVDWVDGYLADQHIVSEDLQRSLRDARRQLDHPTRHRVRRSFERSRRAAGRLVARAGPSKGAGG